MAIVVSAVALVYTAGVILDIAASVTSAFKKITRLSPSDSLNEIGGSTNDLGGGKDINNISSTAQSLIENGVKAAGVDIIVNNSINSKENNEVGTNSNKDIETKNEKKQY